jgi:hypothetical protein
MPDDREMKIAALAGAGVSLKEVAAQTGSSLSSVKLLMAEKVEKNIDGLGDIYQDFRRQIGPIIEALITKTLRRLNEKLDAKGVQIRDLVSVYRELAPAAGMDGHNNSQETRTRIARVDLSNPEMVKALRGALAVERVEVEKEKTTQDTG